MTKVVRKKKLDAMRRACTTLINTAQFIADCKTQAAADSWQVSAKCHDRLIDCQGDAAFGALIDNLNALAALPSA
jgi:hypothetical protein